MDQQSFWLMKLFSKKDQFYVSEEYLWVSFQLKDFHIHLYTW